MAMDKLTKGSVSRIRRTEAEVLELVGKGYRLDGEVDENYAVINDDPFGEEKPAKAKKAKKEEAE